MFFSHFRLSFFVVTAAVVVSAQSTGDHTLDVQAIQAHFRNAGIVPTPLTTFNPVAVLQVKYPNLDTIKPGQPLTIDNVKPAPSLTLEKVNATTTLPTRYTVAMIDADTVGADQSGGQTRHWLVNNVTLNGDALVLEGAAAITGYAGPFPAAGSGPHRYVLLVYAQPDAFAPPENLAAPGVPVAKFDFVQYATTSGLIGPIAGNYIQVEQGTATASYSPTSAVVTSTLPAAQSTPRTGTGSTTGTGTAATPSKTTSGSEKNVVAYATMILSALVATYMF